MKPDMSPSSSPPVILIRGATVLTIDPIAGNQTCCDILIEGDIIKAIGPNLPLSSDGDATIIDAKNCIVTPGFVDGHHHMWQQLIRGLTTDWSLFDYMVNIRSLYSGLFTAEDVYVANYVASLSLLNNGVTSVLDHCHIINSPEHADAAIRGLKDAGIRGTFCYGFFANSPAPGISVPGVNLAHFDISAREVDAARVLSEHFASNDPAKDLLTFGTAPDEPEILPIEETLRQINKSRELGARIITMHVAMGPYDAKRRQVVQQLADAGALGHDLVFSHGASLSDREIDALAVTGAGVVGTPDTELQLGMGFPVVFPAMDKGCRACLGLDITSNQGNDFIAQMRLALQVQRGREAEQGLPITLNRKTADVLRMGTLGGAEVMRLEHLVGSIAVGKKADLVIFRCDDIETTPMNDPVSSVVFHVSVKHIDTVIVNGRIVKKGGSLVGIEWPALEKDLRRRCERIKERAAQIDLDTLKGRWLEAFTA